MVSSGCLPVEGKCFRSQLKNLFPDIKRSTILKGNMTFDIGMTSVFFLCLKP